MFFTLFHAVLFLSLTEFVSLKRRIRKYRMTRKDVHDFFSNDYCELCDKYIPDSSKKNADHCHYNDSLRIPGEVRSEGLDVIVDGEKKVLMCYPEGLQVYQGMLCGGWLGCNPWLEGLSGKIVATRHPLKPRHKTLLTPQSKVMASLARKKKINVDTPRARRYLHRRTKKQKSWLTRVLFT